MNKEKALEALERLYKSNNENYFAPFPTRSDLDTIRQFINQNDMLEVVKKYRHEAHIKRGLDGYNSLVQNEIVAILNKIIVEVEGGNK